jgi:uncharacterized Zn-finger protein
MGMFDTVKMNCPSCGKEIEVQSKAGECVMAEYDINNAPAVILLDVSSKIIECDECNERFRLNFEYRTRIDFVGDESSRWKNPNP